MSTVSYKCPNCGGPLQFRPELQKSKCDFCLGEFSDEELAKINQVLEEKAEKATENEAGPESGESHIMGYVCDSCGAEVVTEENTAATFCYYCHNPVLLSARLTGEFKPDKIIPFTYSREKAIESFLAWAKSKKFVPKEFYSSSQLEKITGMYIPYWIADYKTAVNYEGKGTCRRTWQTGSTEHTEVKEYNFVRKGTIEINKVPAIAMKKIEKELLDSISPYDEGKIVDFSMSYLSGFFAEKYDVGQVEAEPAIESQVKEYVNTLVNESLGNFQSVSFDASDLTVIEKKWYYTLMPVWILTYFYKGKTYVYAVNGQNGVSYGELPVNKGKLGLTSGLLTACVLVAGMLGGLFIW